MKPVDTNRKLPSQIKPVPLAKMRVSVNAQRELRPGRVNALLSDFDLDELGLIVVNQRDGFYWIIDGQHRTEALKQWLGEWENQQVECRVYTGLTEKQEAEMFDRLNNQLTVGALDKFKVRVTAGRPSEVAVSKIVQQQGLKIGTANTTGNIGAVSTLVRVYERAGPSTLSRALRIAHGSFGDQGMSAPVIDGMGHLCERYNGALQDEKTVERLNTMRGGIGALMSRADVLKKQTRRPMAQCVAAAVVDILNSTRGGSKLPSWWSA
jgi:hypothetical protein